MASKENKRNVAIIIPGGIGTGRNNIGVPVLERIIKLLAINFNITVFQLYKTNDDYVASGFELIDVYSPYPWLKSAKAALALWKAHRKKKFVAIHGFWILPGGFLAVVLGKLLNVKSIVSVLGGDAIAMPEINYGQLVKPLYRRVSFWTLAKADNVTALTRYLVENLQSIGMKPRHVDVIPWGIDTDVFVFRAKQLQKPIRFLHIANLHPVKDQETLLRAFKVIAEHVESHLTLIGEGILELRVKALAKELNIERYITFQGLLPYDVLPKYYHQADILLHTSRSEGQSEVVTEAMSSGALVCGTRVGLIHDLENCCVSVNVGDYQSLSQKLLDLISQPERMTQLRNQAGNWAKMHSIYWTVQQTGALYSKE